MLNLDDISKNFRAILASLLGMDSNSIRKANQGAPTGTQADQFATVLLSTIGSVGVEENKEGEGEDDAHLTETTVGMKHLVASVQFFRGDALSKASRLGTLLRGSKATASLQQAGLGLVKVGSVTNLTSLIDTYWEERGQVEVELYCISEEQASVPSFDGTFPVSVDSDPTPY